jgi:hypothetical protein
MGGPRESDLAEANNHKRGEKLSSITMERKCTDCVWTIVMVVVLGASIAVSCWGVMNGDPNRILVPFDSDGNECGKPLQAMSAVQGERDFTEYKYKYFTKVIQKATSASTKKYNAVCVKTCPSAVPVLGSEEF